MVIDQYETSCSKQLFNLIPSKWLLHTLMYLLLLKNSHVGKFCTKTVINEIEP